MRSQTKRPALFGQNLFEFAQRSADAVTSAIRSIKYAAANLTMKARAGVFEPWVPLLKFAKAQPHGVPLIESAALAAIKSPIPHYQPILAPELIETGALSEAQLEAITLIGQAHTGTVQIRELNWDVTSSRRGFKLGAGMGTGKSRILLGSYIDNLLQQREKAIFITESAELIDTLRADFQALGRNPNDIVPMGEWSITEPITLDSGILFLTYAMLRGYREVGETRYRRVNQIIAWMADCRDGLIIFDESQNLGNAVRRTREDPGSGPKDNGSKQGVIALELQRRMPDARIIYSSATSDDHIDSLAYAPRLGLWGIDTPFHSRTTFLEAMSGSGIAAMEVVCQHLKAQGLYWAPQLSAEGITTEILVHPLSQAEVSMINAFNAVWRKIEGYFNEALVATQAAHQSAGGRMINTIAGSGASQARLSYVSAQQRFYSLAYMSLRMPTVIAHMRQRLSAGEACVLQFHNTFEASQKTALEQYDPAKDVLADLDVSPRGVLIQWIEANFPTTQHKITHDKKGNERAHVVKDPITGAVVQNEQALYLRENLVDAIKELILPENPLDVLINAFGPEQIAEITGRSQRLVYKEVGSKHVRTLERRNKRSVATDLADFMDDRKQILAFSESKGGIGQSYHADLSRKNQRKRNHYLLQVSWRAVDALQGLGRTHRTNQACPPHYVLTTTSIPAETRFISTIAKRLGELGALTRGNREADGSILIDQSMSLENEYAEEALDQMIAEIGAGMDREIDPQRFFDQIGINPVPYAERWAQGSGGKRNAERLRGLPAIDIKRFLNRLMAVDIDTQGGLQGVILGGLTRRMNERREAAKAKGTYDPGLRTIAGLSVKIADERMIYEDRQKHQWLKVVTIERTEAASTTTFESAKLSLSYLKAMHPHDKRAGWVMRRDNVPELRLPIYVGTIDSGTRISSPYGSRYAATANELAKTTMPTTEERAAEAWAKALKKPREVETERVHLVVGTLLPFWQSFYGATSAKTKKGEDPHRPTIWKAVTDAGRPVIGIRFTEYRDTEVLVTLLHQRIQDHLKWEEAQQKRAHEFAVLRRQEELAKSA